MRKLKKLRFLQSPLSGGSAIQLSRIAFIGSASLFFAFSPSLSAQEKPDAPALPQPVPSETSAPSADPDTAADPVAPPNPPADPVDPVAPPVTNTSPLAPDAVPLSPLQPQPQSSEFNPDLPVLFKPPAQAILPKTTGQEVPQTTIQTPENAKPVAPVQQIDSAERTDPIRRTALQGSETVGETLMDGVGQTPNPLGSSFLNANADYTPGILVGPITFHPVIGIGLNEISLRPENGENRDLAAVTAIGSFDLVLGEPATGKVITASYVGSYAIGASQENAYNQSLAVRGNLAFTKISLGLGIQFDQLSGANRDFGKETRRNLFTLSLISSFKYSPKTTFDWDVTLPVRSFDGGRSSVEVTSTNSVNFAYSQKTTVGLGVTLGTVEPETGSSQKYAQVFSHLQYQFSELVSTNFIFGVEERDTGEAQRTAPIFGLGIVWRPRLGTTISLSGDRRVIVSAADAGTNFVTTSGAITLEQRLGDFWSIQVTTGIEHAEYSSTERDVFTSRNDTYFLGQVGLRAQINARWVASLLFSYGNNQSSANDSLQLYQSSLYFSYLF